MKETLIIIGIGIGIVVLVVWVMVSSLSEFQKEKLLALPKEQRTTEFINTVFDSLVANLLK
jgi:hypothetical protein